MMKRIKTTSPLIRKIPTVKSGSILSDKSTKQVGDTLEYIVEELCQGYENAKVTRNAIILGKSSVQRQIDLLIEATHKSFDIKIIVEAKNYSKKVGVEVIEALRTKLFDVSGHVGVVVCPLGFTEGAVKAAVLADIQLFQAFDHKLGNTAQLIPLRCISADPGAYQLQISHGAMGSGFSLPSDIRKLRFDIKGDLLKLSELATYAWNTEMIPQKAGDQLADFGVLKVSTDDSPTHFYYLEVKLNMQVTEEYYLKLFPASFMKNIRSAKGNHQLKIDMYSKKEDMIKNGWKPFSSLEEMEIEAATHDTSSDMSGLVVRPQSTYKEA